MHILVSITEIVLVYEYCVVFAQAAQWLGYRTVVLVASWYNAGNWYPC